MSDLILTSETSLNDGKLVADKTGLTGKYDFKMNLALTGGFSKTGMGPLTSGRSVVGPDIFAPLTNTLG